MTKVFYFFSSEKKALPSQLSGAESGTNAIVLVAGLSGSLAIYELRKAGCSVRML